MSIKNWVLCFMLVWSAGGCATANHNIQKTNIDAAVHIWILNASDIEVVESGISSETVFLHFNAYLQENETIEEFYAKVDLLSNQNKQIRSDSDFVVSLELIDSEEFKNASKEYTQLINLSGHYWQNFLSILKEHVSPKEDNKAAVVVFGRNELVYYRQDGAFFVCEIEQKPKEIQIVQSYGQKEFKEISLALLKEYLKKLGISDKQVLLTTLQGIDPSKPFLFVDFNQELILQFKVLAGNQKRYEESLLAKGVKSVDALIFDSHLVGILSRPFSSATQLFSWGANRTFDMVQPRSFILLERQPIGGLYEGEGMDLVKWEKDLDKILKRKSLSAQLDFLVGGDDFFLELIKALSEAKKTIDVRIFIFDNDDYAVKIADLLKQKSSEGVKVRVLLDSMGQMMGEGKMPPDLPNGFIPPKSMEWYLKQNSNIEVRVRPTTWFKADHTKTITIDNDVTFTGGMNIGREYRYNWHDLMIKMQGKVIEKVVNEFNLAWEYAGSFGDIGYLKSLIFDSVNIEDVGGAPVRLIYTKVNNQEIFKTQIEAIRRAKKYIYIHNSYFSDNTILYEVLKARRRGVDVRVILPIKGNHEIMNQSNIVTANILFRNGIKVYFYPGMSHVKAAVYDGWLITGSANFDKLSFEDNQEMNIATSDKDAVETILNEIFYPDFEKSTLMTESFKSTFKDVLAEALAEQL